MRNPNVNYRYVCVCVCVNYRKRKFVVIFRKIVDVSDAMRIFALINDPQALLNFKGLKFFDYLLCNGKVCDLALVVAEVEEVGRATN